MKKIVQFHDAAHKRSFMKGYKIAKKVLSETQFSVILHEDAAEDWNVFSETVNGVYSVSAI